MQVAVMELLVAVVPKKTTFELAPSWYEVHAGLVSFAIAALIILGILAFVMVQSAREDTRAHFGLDGSTRKAIRRRGQRAPAVVVTRDRSRRVNDWLELVVEVRPMDGSPFRAEVACMDVFDDEVRPGAKVQVFFVPKDRKKVLVDTEQLAILLKRDRSDEERARAERKAAEEAAFEERRKRALRGEDPE